MLDKYVFGAHAVLLVYDVTKYLEQHYHCIKLSLHCREETFIQLSAWLEQCRAALAGQEKVLQIGFVRT